MKHQKNVVIKRIIIPELVSGSSTQAVTQRQALKTLKKFQGLSNFTTTHGFTLIELLVVVLIIGILAAVALPQYQRAVTKSRIAEKLVKVQELKQAQQVYFLEHGQYATQLKDLEGISPSDCVIEGQQGFYCALQKPLTVFSYQYVGKYSCCAYPEDNYAGEFVCQSLAGTTNWSNGCSMDRICRCYKM